MDNSEPFYMLNALWFRPEGGAEKYSKYLEAAGPVTQKYQVQLAPELLVQDIERVKSTFTPQPEPVNGEYDLSLIGRSHLRSNNSWMHNSLSLVKGKNRCTLLMHPADAAARGIANHQKVRVDSRIGSLEIAVEITDAIMSGVVSIPHG